MPDRKSAAKDAQWIAELLYNEMLRSSMIPNPVIQELRVYSRKYTRLQGRITGTLQEMDRIIVMCGYHISSCTSNLETKSVMNIIMRIL
jgi:hypothetical protein